MTAGTTAAYHFWCQANTGQGLPILPIDALSSLASGFGAATHGTGVRALLGCCVTVAEAAGGSHDR